MQYLHANLKFTLNLDPFLQYSHETLKPTLPTNT
jgi:hypothetical protein